LLLDGLDRTLLVVGLGAARTVPLTMSIPAFGGPHLAAPIRFGLGLALAGLCYPLLFPQLPHGGDWLWALMVAREVVVGVVMGLRVPGSRDLRTTDGPSAGGERDGCPFFRYRR